LRQVNDDKWNAAVSRSPTETDRLKFGAMKATFFQTERDDDGKPSGVWIACGNKYESELGELMQAISHKVNALIAELRRDPAP
jgi:hypothetical protein